MSARVLAGGAAALLALAACASAPRKEPPFVEQARVQRATGDGAHDLGDPSAGAHAYARALASARAADDQRLAADVGYRLGLALLAAGDPVAAASELEDAARVARRAGDPGLAARALLGLARARDVVGGDPRPALREALALAAEAGDATPAALAHVGLGAAGPAAEAAAHYDEADRLAGRAPAVAAPLALNRARLAEKAGDAARAGARYRAAADAYRALDDALGLHLALAGAARGADRSGPPADAADLHRRAASAALAAGLRSAAVKELRAAAAAHRRAGEEAEAARREAEAARLLADPEA